MVWDSNHQVPSLNLTKFDVCMYGGQIVKGEDNQELFYLDENLILENLDKNFPIDVDALLKTPSEEYKTLSYEMNNNLTGNSFDSNLYNKPTYEENMMEMENAFDFSQHIDNNNLNTNTTTSNQNYLSESLQTPNIDANANFIQPPIFPNPMINTLNSPTDETLFNCGSPDEICGQSTVLTNPSLNVFTNLNNNNNNQYNIKYEPNDNIDNKLRFSPESFTYTELKTINTSSPSSLMNSNSSLSSSYTQSSNIQIMPSGDIYTKTEQPLIPTVINNTDNNGNNNDHNYLKSTIIPDNYSSISSPATSVTSTFDSEHDTFETKYKRSNLTRTKTNEASKRSRQTKKEKFLDIQAKKNSLELENENLKKTVEVLEKQKDHLHKYLMNYMKSQKGK